MEIEELYKIYIQNPNVQTDTRKIKPGDKFFALKGDNFDGNTFALQALALGASYAVCDDSSLAGTDKRIIIVQDVLSTLQSLAKHHRMQFNIPFLAITGSNGKTTTKELISAVLSSGMKCYTTDGNLNNHIGIPLTLLKVQPDAEIAVVEMGANHQKEIESYCAYAMPTHGLITNVGKAHLEGFGGEAGVRKGKGELFDYLRVHGGTAFICTDYDYLKEMSTGIPNVVEYGTYTGLVTGTASDNENYLEVRIHSGLDVKNIRTQLTGTYNLPNVLAACTAGKYFGLPDEKIKTAIENYAPSNSRSQVIKRGTNTIILDAYNANPSSMKAAIENIAKLPGENKILVLGSMKELGNESAAEHAALIRLVQKYKWQHVVLAGKEYENVPEGIAHFIDSIAAKEWFQNLQPKDSTILIKGSRSMQMERVLAENT